MVDSPSNVAGATSEYFARFVSQSELRRFIAISDAYEWPSGLTMEHAIGALERELARESRPTGRDAPSPFGE
jgi:hypothetical protein